MSLLTRRFGRAVRQLRELRGWSQEGLAEVADLNRSYLGEVERGDAVPSLETTGKLAHALGISLSTLLARCEEHAVAEVARAISDGYTRLSDGPETAKIA